MKLCEGKFKGRSQEKRTLGPVLEEGPSGQRSECLHLRRMSSFYKGMIYRTIEKAFRMASYFVLLEVGVLWGGSAGSWRCTGGLSLATCNVSLSPPPPPPHPNQGLRGGVMWLLLV